MRGDCSHRNKNQPPGPKPGSLGCEPSIPTSWTIADLIAATRPLVPTAGLRSGSCGLRAPNPPLGLRWSNAMSTSRSIRSKLAPKTIELDAKIAPKSIPRGVLDGVSWGDLWSVLRALGSLGTPWGFGRVLARDATK